ncbi:unnamed protein product [Calypogeia fissa]
MAVLFSTPVPSNGIYQYEYQGRGEGQKAVQHYPLIMTLIEVGCPHAREFISQLAESYPKEYCRQLEVVHLLEALYKHHTAYGLVNAKYLGIIDKVDIAGWFFDEWGNVMPIEEVLRNLPLSRYDLPGSNLLSREVIRQVAVRRMDHDQVIEQEKADRAAQGKDTGVGTSKPTPIALQSKSKPRTPSPSRLMEVTTMATPLEQPVGSVAAIEEEEPALSGHSNESLTPMADIDRLIAAAEVIWAEVDIEEALPMEEVTTGTEATEDITLELVTLEEEAVDDVANEALATEGATKVVVGVEVIDLESPIKMVPKANKRTPMAISCLPKGLIDDQRNIISGVQVWEAEEVRGGSTNWMKHFAGTFHQQLALSKSTKKTKLGNHIRVILQSMEWIGEEQVRAPSGYPTVMVAKHPGRPKPKPKAKTPQAGESLKEKAGESSKEKAGVSKEVRARRTPNTKTIPSPSPILKPTQARDVTPIPMTSSPREDMPIPMEVEEPPAPVPPTRDTVVPTPAVQKRHSITMEHHHHQRSRRSGVYQLCLHLRFLLLTLMSNNQPNPLKITGLEFMRPVISAHITRGEQAALHEMTKISNKEFSHGLLQLINPKIKDYSTRDY